MHDNIEYSSVIRLRLQNGLYVKNMLYFARNAICYIYSLYFFSPGFNIKYWYLQKFFGLHGWLRPHVTPGRASPLDSTEGLLTLFCPHPLLAPLLGSIGPPGARPGGSVPVISDLPLHSMIY